MTTASITLPGTTRIRPTFWARIVDDAARHLSSLHPYGVLHL